MACGFRRKRQRSGGWGVGREKSNFPTVKSAIKLKCHIVSFFRLGSTALRNLVPLSSSRRTIKHTLFGASSDANLYPGKLRFTSAYDILSRNACTYGQAPAQLRHVLTTEARYQTSGTAVRS